MENADAGRREMPRPRTAAIRRTSSSAVAGLPGAMAPAALVGVANITNARRQGTRNLGRVAQQVDPMGVSPTDYPAIPFNDDDRIREESLKKIGRAFQAEMDAQANPCACGRPPRLPPDSARR